ncbi:aminotransferase class V-fold PLP-dependent enzyme [Candidatus Parcubacteria bacterium]|nr:aminotransferase class V-fold PLP-dependent enzyme [Candidatus Parcubacteria bacterium]
MFPKRRTYLDYAAGVSANPSSPHTEGRRAKRILEDARTAIARLVEVQPDDVIFTSGATEANALAILGHARALRTADKKDIHILYLPSAHASIVENAKLLALEGVVVEPLPIKDYRVNTEALLKLLRENTAFITMDAVCGETGVVWNTREVAEVLKKSIASAAVLHVDASQAPITEKITRAHFGADMLTFDAAKVGPLRGAGVLIAHRTIPLIPLYEGGGQERGLRSGSETPFQSREFARALHAAVNGREAFRASAMQDRKKLVERIISAIPNVYINEGRVQVPHILNLSFPGRDTDYLIALLDEAGFALSTRSACETDSETGSRAVYALSGDELRARATVRISWGPAVSAREFSRFVQALVRAVTFIDNGVHG